MRYVVSGNVVQLRRDDELSPNKRKKTKERRQYEKSTTGYTSSGIRCAHASEAIPPGDFQKIKDYFLGTKKTRYGLRNYTLLLLGCNVGMRCGDLTYLHVGDVMRDGQIKTDVEYYAEKTRTWEHMYIAEVLKPQLMEYIDTLKDKSYSAWLFPAERGGRMNTDSVGVLFRRTKKALGLTIHLGTHSMRKTLGKTAYPIYGASGVRELLRQRSEKSALHYIGVQEEDVMKKALDLPTFGI